jgi:acetyl esterase/lipase
MSGRFQVIAMFLLGNACVALAQATQTNTKFTVTLQPPAHGTMLIQPPIPADGKVPAGTVLSVKISPDKGYAIDSGFCTGRAPWSPAYFEFFTPEFHVIADQDRKIGASFIEKKALKGVTVIRNVIYARPGVKRLVYDVYSPRRAHRLPCIIIIHGGGFIFNTQGIMRGLARELVRGGKYVVFSIDYRWFGTRDGDIVSNTLPDIVEDMFGAIAHIQEHAKKYGGDPARIAVTGDSAGGYLAAVAIDMVNQIGDGGFGVKEGVYEFNPTYLPHGKSIAQVRKEMIEAIKVAAPSYGEFSAERLAVSDAGTNQPQALLKALAPVGHIPNIHERAVPQLLLRGKLDPTIEDGEVQRYADALKAAGQKVEYVRVDGVGHAFLDWKPDAVTEATFVKYGVPNIARMEAFFDSVFYCKTGL